MKNKLRVWIILAVILAVYTVLTFALPFEKNAVLWVSYLFGAVAIAAQVYVVRTAFGKGKSLKSKFYGFPVAEIGAIYLLAQLVLGLVFMALARVAPVWLPVVVYVVLLGAAAVGFIAADAAADIVTEVDDHVKADTLFIRSLTADAESLLSKAKGDEIRAVCKKVYEAARYSDPVSNPALAPLESEITLRFSAFSEASMAGDTEKAIQLADETITLLGDRNKRCKLLK